MDDPGHQLEAFLADIAGTLKPAQRRKLMVLLARELRRRHQQRIRDQIDPEGQPFEPRKPRHLKKRGRIKRRALFAKLRTAKYLRMRADADSAEVGLAGRVARIARVHHEGLEDRVAPGGPRVRYARRGLVGVGEGDVGVLAELLFDYFSNH